MKLILQAKQQRRHGCWMRAVPRKQPTSRKPPSTQTKVQLKYQYKPRVKAVRSDHLKKNCKKDMSAQTSNSQVSFGSLQPVRYTKQPQG